MENSTIKKIHHLNCCTNMPKGGKLINGRSPAKICCHCLLVETDQGLILIDTGIGIEDMKDPSRTGPLYLVNRPRQNEEETAFRQIERLGLRPQDVRHIIMTHLDLDHTGGLPDFPDATIHVYKKEFDAAMTQKKLSDKIRYRNIHWAHSPDWCVHDYKDDDQWFGFNAIRYLAGLPHEIVLIPLPGHTKGHCGVSVKTDQHWVFFVADAYFYHKETDRIPKCTPGLKLFQFFAHTDRQLARETKKKLRHLKEAENENVILISAHDRDEFEHFSGTQIR